jgi:uncharacterized integral membrane protein
MWLVRSVLVFLIIVGIVVFAIGNVEYRTTVRLFTKTYYNAHLSLVVGWAVVFGASVCFLLMIFREFGLRHTIRKLRRENMRLDDEVTALRNLPLSGLPQGGPPNAAS